MPGLASFDRTLLSKIGERKATAFILELDASGQVTGKRRRFQYFPETVADTRASNYSTRDVPGGSLPLYEWINGGERVISFTAWFTSDVDLIAPTDDSLGLNLTFGGIGDRLKAAGELGNNVDIRSAILWLRRFMMPTYTANGSMGTPLVNPPPRMMLVLPNSGIGLGAGLGSIAGSYDQIMCVMQTCDVNYEAFFPTGLPRIASVSLGFAQVAQSPDGSVTFPGWTVQIDEQVDGTGAQTPDTFLGYNLTEERWK